MKTKLFIGFACGLVLGLLVGYLLAALVRSRSGQPAGPGKGDHVLATLDVPSLITTAGEGKWTVIPIPNEQVKEWHTNPPLSPPEAKRSTTTWCFVARGDLLESSVDQEHDFFQKVLSRLRAALSTSAVVESGGSIEGVPPYPEQNQRKCRYSCSVVHFHTTAEAGKQRHGGLRGSATVWLTSNGQSAILLVTLTEVTNADD
jgi:hypothetical protein